MTGRVIPLRGDGHNQAQALLPWYVSGRLDPDERANVEAHLAECSECQAELKVERRLNEAAASAPIPEAAGDIARGWASMRRRMEIGPDTEAAPRRAQPARKRLWPSAGAVTLPWTAGPAWMRWALGGQLALLVLLAAYVTPILRHDQARYHALGAAPAVSAANVVVIFRPDITERELRRTLSANHARLVDGPTATDAYLLHVPAAERAAVLTRLRHEPRIELAEPVDSGALP